ncbi:MAG: hypothetical protein ACJA2L_002270, partial [Polaribacter sp.]
RIKGIKSLAIDDESDVCQLIYFLDSNSALIFFIFINCKGSPAPQETPTTNNATNVPLSSLVAIPKIAIDNNNVTAQIKAMVIALIKYKFDNNCAVVICLKSSFIILDF